MDGYLHTKVFCCRSIELSQAVFHSIETYNGGKKGMFAYKLDNMTTIKQNA